jgi:hypothetical protein
MTEKPVETSLIEEYKTISKEVSHFEKLRKEDISGLSSDQEARLNNLILEKGFIGQKLLESSEKKITFEMYDNLERQLGLLIRELEFTPGSKISVNGASSADEVYEAIIVVVRESMTADKRFFKNPQFFRSKKNAIDPSALRSLLEESLADLKNQSGKNYINLEKSVHDLISALQDHKEN